MAGLSIERKVSWGTIISAAVQLLVLAIFITTLSANVAGAQKDITEIKAWEADTNNTVSSLENRLTSVEINQKNGTDRGQQFQADTKASMADIRVALNDLRLQNVQMLQTLAALSATLRQQNPGN